jgi:hypothetical protein
MIRVAAQAVQLQQRSSPPPSAAAAVAAADRFGEVLVARLTQRPFFFQRLTGSLAMRSNDTRELESTTYWIKQLDRVLSTRKE